MWVPVIHTQPDLYATEVLVVSQPPAGWVVNFCSDWENQMISAEESGLLLPVCSLYKMWWKEPVCWMRRLFSIKVNLSLNFQSIRICFFMFNGLLWTLFYLIWLKHHLHYKKHWDFFIHFNFCCISTFHSNREHLTLENSNRLILQFVFL